MVAHNHSEYVLGCFRCDLSRDEEIKEEKSMSFIEQVVEASWFNWDEWIGHKVLTGEIIYWLGGVTLTEYNGYITLTNHDEIVSLKTDGSIPAPVVAQVIDLLIKNYREA